MSYYNVIENGDHLIIDHHLANVPNGNGAVRKQFLMKFLNAEHGEGVSLMRQIKNTFDPNNIMNPGKIFTP